MRHRLRLGLRGALHDSETTATGWTVDVQEATVVINPQAAKVVFLLALVARLSKVGGSDINAHDHGTSLATRWKLGDRFPAKTALTSISAPSERLVDWSHFSSFQALTSIFTITSWPPSIVHLTTSVGAVYFIIFILSDSGASRAGASLASSGYEKAGTV
jgi:hypothetical protein